MFTTLMKIFTKLLEDKFQEIGYDLRVRGIQGSNAKGQKHQKVPEQIIEKINNH